MKREVSARGMAEEMLSFQFLVSVLALAFFPFHNDFFFNLMQCFSNCKVSLGRC
jgi:hypothetical protein